MTAISDTGSDTGRWVRGDLLGLEIPTDGQALGEGGPIFLTAAFRAAGSLGEGQEVAAVTRLEECKGGSTGRKFFLTVSYDGAPADLPTELFVKFSRDFDDTIRDRGRDQLEPEVRLGLLSRHPAFPIAVPRCLFADYESVSGSGLLITACVPFGRDGIERAYDKCLDTEVPDALDHYHALMTAVARLAGTHKGGALMDQVALFFPYDASRWAGADRIRYSAVQLQNRVARFAQFAAEFPQLVPANIADPAFIARLHGDVVRFLEHEAAIKAWLHAPGDLVALCHWNANIDNGWYWRDEAGALQCGLMDWGRVSQMNVALAIWGCLSAAEVEMWDDHLGDLLGLFAREYEAAGGPRIGVDRLALNLYLFVATMGLAWLMDAPPLIRAAMPDLADTTGRLDPRFRSNEMARTQLHMLTNFLNLWQTHDYGAVLDRFLAEQGLAS